MPQRKALGRVDQVRGRVRGGGAVQRNAVLPGKYIECLRHADRAVDDGHAPALLAAAVVHRAVAVPAAHVLARPQCAQVEAEPALDVGEQRAFAGRAQDSARILALQTEPGDPARPRSLTWACTPSNAQRRRPSTLTCSSS